MKRLPDSTFTPAAFGAKLPALFDRPRRPRAAKLSAEHLSAGRQLAASRVVF